MLSSKCDTPKKRSAEKIHSSKSDAPKKRSAEKKSKEMAKSDDEEEETNSSTASKDIDTDDTMIDIYSEILDVSHSSAMARPHPPTPDRRVLLQLQSVSSESSPETKSGNQQEKKTVVGPQRTRSTDERIHESPGKPSSKQQKKKNLDYAHTTGRRRRLWRKRRSRLTATRSAERKSVQAKATTSTISPSCSSDSDAVLIYYDLVGGDLVPVNVLDDPLPEGVRLHKVHFSHSPPGRTEQYNRYRRHQFEDKLEDAMSGLEEWHKNVNEDRNPRMLDAVAELLLYGEQDEDTDQMNGKEAAASGVTTEEQQKQETEGENETAQVHFVQPQNEEEGMLQES